jgi:hypothetical protein
MGTRVRRTLKVKGTANSWSWNNAFTPKIRTLMFHESAQPGGTRWPRARMSGSVGHGKDFP